jgi:hypothetical protein
MSKLQRPFGPGTSRLGTISLSLRDKSHSPIEAPQNLTLLHLNRLKVLTCRQINTVPRRPLELHTNNLDTSTHHSKTLHASSGDANKLGGSRHSSDDNNPNALERSGLAVTKQLQLRLNLIETFS